MPYDWRTGLAVANPAGPPRPPDTVPSLWPKPQPKPVYDPFSNWQQGHPGTKPPVKKTVAPLDPWEKLYRQLMGTFETPAQMEARVNREINAQIAAQKKLLDDEYARQQANAQAQAAGMEAAGQAAAAMSKDLFGAVGGEFNAAAGEISGLAHGLTKGVEGATGHDVAGANAFLEATGNAPVATSGTLSVGGATQQGVEDFRGGTLPSQMLGTQGEAAQFGLAGMASAQNMKAHEEAQAALITTTRQINDAQSKAIQALAAGRGDLYHTYMNDARDAQIKYISLAQGILAQQQASKAAGFKQGLDYQKFQLSVANFNRLTKGQNFSQKIAAIKEQRLAGTAGFNQSVTTKKLEMQAARDAIAAGQVNIPLSKAKGVLYNKAGQVMVDANGKPISSKGLLPAGAGTKKGGLTDLQLTNMVTSWKTGKAVSGKVPVIVGYNESAPDKNGDTRQVPIIRMLAPGQTYTVLTGDTKGQTRVVPGAAAKNQRNYQEGFKTLLALGVDPLKAQTVMNQSYKRGEQGRSWLTAQERQQLVAAGIDPTAQLEWVPESRTHVGANVGWLTRMQVAVLRSKGMLPRGYYSDNHDRYYITVAF